MTKPFKIDKFTPIPQGMRRVHVKGYYMAYPEKVPRKKAPPKNKAAAKK